MHSLEFYWISFVTSNDSLKSLYKWQWYLGEVLQKYFVYWILFRFKGQHETVNKNKNLVLQLALVSQPELGLPHMSYLKLLSNPPISILFYFHNFNVNQRWDFFRKFRICMFSLLDFVKLSLAFDNLKVGIFLKLQFIREGVVYGLPYWTLFF
jgi:hypothetical protein